jgi:pseudouridine kinase
MEAVRSQLDVVCFGGAVLDRTYQVSGSPIAETSNPATAMSSFGGVARNVAETLARLGRVMGFVSAVGDDEAGRSIVAQLTALGVDMSDCVIAQNASTAEYAAILDGDGALHMGLAAMDVFEVLTPHVVATLAPVLSNTQWVFADTNPPAETLAALIGSKPGFKQGFKLAVDTVSVTKARRLPSDLNGVDVLFTNQDEACAMIGDHDHRHDPVSCAKTLQDRGAQNVLLTLGRDGHLIAHGEQITHVAACAEHIANVTGAGDALIAGTLHGLLNTLPLVAASKMGAELAALTLAVPSAVVPNLTSDFLLQGRL